jgi:hypothetical protein
MQNRLSTKPLYLKIHTRPHIFLGALIFKIPRTKKGSSHFFRGAEPAQEAKSLGLEPPWLYMLSAAPYVCLLLLVDELE